MRASPIFRLAIRAGLLLTSVSVSAQTSITQHSAADRPRINIPAAVIDDTLEVGGDDLKSREVDSRMTINVRVNGQGPYRFVVDSGADRSVIGARLASSLHLPSAGEVRLHTMAGTSVVSTVSIDRLAVGPTTMENVQAPALAEANLGAQGMLGIDMLAERRLMMDFDRDEMRIEDARRAAVSEAGDIVVTARRRKGQLILTEARIATIPVQAVIDTGSQITIGNISLRDRVLKRRRFPLQQVQLVSVTGVPVTVELGIVPEMRLGSVVLQNVALAFADVPPFALFDLAEQPALLLGTDVIGSFRRVSLDFKARKVRFQLRDCQITAPRFAYGLSRLATTGPSSRGCVPQRRQRRPAPIPQAKQLSSPAP